MEGKQFIKRFYAANKLNFAVILFAHLLNVVITLILAYEMQRVIDIAASGTLSELLTVVYRLLGIIGTCAVYVLLRSVFLPRYKARASRQYKDYAYENCLKKSISEFGKSGSAEYISALTNDLNIIEQNYIANIFGMIENILIFIGALAMMIYYSPILSAVGVGATLIPFGMSMLFGKTLGKREKEASDKNGSFVHFVSDSLNGFSVIKNFKIEDKIGGLFAHNNADLERTKEKRDRASVFMSEVNPLLGALVQFAVFGVGAYLCITQPQNMTPGILIMFVQLMNCVITPITVVPRTLAERKACKPLINKVAELSRHEENDGKELTAAHEHAIELNNVNFAYIEGQNVINDLSCTFEKNKSYAIVGASGSGKTTLFNLLLGMHDDYTGSIAYDGNELNNIRSDSLYDCISLVSQNIFVFDDTVGNNITLWKDTDKAALDEAVEKAALSDLVQEKGIDYDCGLNGGNLSGGQKQRISVARGFIKHAPLLLMDEATSALDAETAARINSEILDIKDTTKIVITHRLDENTLERYDKILFMKNGAIAESGTFAELIKANGLFASMYKLAQ